MAAHRKHIRKFERDVRQCMKCGFCGYFCPIYREDRQEKGLARGKDQLVRFALAGEPELTPGFYQAMDNCLLCRTCVQYCPAGTRIDHAVTAARADYVAQHGLPLPKRFVFRYLLPRRRLFGMVLRMASRFQFLLRRGEGRFRHLPHFLSALGAGRAVPEIAPRFLRKMLPARNPARGQRRARVGFFPGCATEYLFPEIGRMIVDVLASLGCEVHVDPRQGCCGAPVLFSGDFRTAKIMAARNIQAFDHCQYVVTGCATCSSGLKEYPVYLADSPEETQRFARFAAKVKDFSQMVLDVLAAHPDRFRLRPEFRGMRVTWHDPCHLARYQDIRRQPRQILAALEDLHFVEMPDADRCCGLGGSFSITHYELSQRIADHKVRAVAASGAEAVVTACPGCMIQLRDALARQAAPTPVLHIGQLFTVQPESAPEFRE